MTNAFFKQNLLLLLLLWSTFVKMLDSKPKTPTGRKEYPCNGRKKQKQLLIFTWNSHSSTSNSSSNRTVHLKTILPSVRLLNMLLMIFLRLLLPSNCCTKFVYFVAYKRQSVIRIIRFIHSIDLSKFEMEKPTQYSNYFSLLLTFRPLNLFIWLFYWICPPTNPISKGFIVSFSFLSDFFTCQISQNVH